MSNRDKKEKPRAASSENEQRTGDNGRVNAGSTPGSQLDSGEGLDEGRIAAAQSVPASQHERHPAQTPPNKPGQYEPQERGEGRRGSTPAGDWRGAVNRPDSASSDADHEGGTEEQIGDRIGPGAGYDESLARQGRNRQTVPPDSPD
jgi:hypothetical protein